MTSSRREIYEEDSFTCGCLCVLYSICHHHPAAHLDDNHGIQNEPGTVPVALFPALTVEVGELRGCLEPGDRYLPFKQRHHNSRRDRIVYICQLPCGLSAGKAQFQVQEAVDICHPGRPDAGAPVFGHLAVQGG